MEENRPQEGSHNKPGALALAAAQECDDIVFKKPLPVGAPKKAFKPEVLVEDTYLEVSFSRKHLHTFNLLLYSV